MPLPIVLSIALIFVIGLWPVTAWAVPAETAFVAQSVIAAIGGCTVFLAASGWGLYTAGRIRDEGASAAAMALPLTLAAAILGHALFGFGLASHGAPGGVLALPGPFRADDVAALAGDFEALAQRARRYASGVYWVAGAMLAALTAVISAGAAFGRLRPWTGGVIGAVVGGLACPIYLSWTRAGGWLSELGFRDAGFGGAAFGLGGWIAAVGVLVLGARSRRPAFEGGGVAPPRTALATVGAAFALPALVLSTSLAEGDLGRTEDAVAMGRALSNLWIGAVAGALSAAVIGLADRTERLRAFDGAFAGVAILAAAPGAPHAMAAALLGAIAGAVSQATPFAINRFGVDDESRAIGVAAAPASLGLLLVAWTDAEARLGAQAIGAGTLILFATAVAAPLWFAARMIDGGEAGSAEKP